VEETNNPEPIDGTVYIAHPLLHKGIAYARNLALKNSAGDIIVFIDDDCSIHDNWLDHLLMPFEEKSVVGAQGGVTVAANTNAVGWVESVLGFPGGGVSRIIQANGKIQETQEISTLNCGYRKHIIENAGGFDERLKFGGEDYLLAKKICQFGTCVFVPHAMVSHAARGGLIKIWKWFKRRGKAEIAVVQTGEYAQANLKAVSCSSVSIKILILAIVALVFPGISWCLIVSFIAAYGILQYSRYFKPMRNSKAPLSALALLPLVKFTMDIAMDWGRLQGLILLYGLESNRLKF
jgi:glycosyltransferase involved in cell wall biosynthesis